jgi:hypothetical protein
MENDMNDMWFKPYRHGPETGARALSTALLRTGDPLFIVDANGMPGVCREGTVLAARHGDPGPDHFRLLTMMMPLRPENLGSADFKKRHGIDTRVLPAPWPTAFHPWNW